MDEVNGDWGPKDLKWLVSETLLPGPSSGL